MNNNNIVDNYQNNEIVQIEDKLPYIYFGKNNNNDKTIILNVYFCGLGATITDTSKLVGLLHKYTVVDENHLKMGFNSCALTEDGNISIPGALFGVGIDKPCKKVLETTQEFIKQGKIVKLLIFGHSRGAIAAAKLAKLLSNYDKDIVEINMALLDPAPGNLIISYKLDLFGTTLATQAQDLSDCRNLCSVLSLYSNIPLVFNKPLIFKYPEKCNVMEDVIPGDHYDIQEINDSLLGIIKLKPRAYIPFFRVKMLLEACGAIFNFNENKILLNHYPDEYEVIQQKLKDNEDNINIVSTIEEDDEYQKITEENAILMCYQHQQEEIKIKQSKKCLTNENVYIKTDPNHTIYLNYHHWQLLQVQINGSINNTDEHSLILRFNRPLKKLQDKHDLDNQDVNELFKQILQEIKNELSEKSKHSEKNSIICLILLELDKVIDKNRLNNINNDDAEKIKFALRNFIAVVLQENDSNKLKYTTNSAIKLLSLLNLEKYKIFSDLILGSCSGPIKFKDLLKFVTGKDDKIIFNSKNKQSLYKLFQGNSDDNSSILTEDKITPYVALKN